MSIINLLGTIKWTQNNSIRKKLEPGLRNMNYYLKPNELMYINMVIDSVSLDSLQDIEDILLHVLIILVMNLVEYWLEKDYFKYVRVI